MPPVDRRPPLAAVSPRRLRPRKNLRSIPSVQTPPASIRANPKTPIRSSLPSDQLMLTQYKLMASELMEMAQRVKEDFNNMGTDPIALENNNSTPLFEKGRFYELYSARRNERLRRRQEEHEVDDTVTQDPGIAVELSKRRNLKKVESTRRSVPANFSLSRGSNLRFSVSSSKEIKKSSVVGSCEKRASVDGGRRVGTKSVLRI